MPPLDFDTAFALSDNPFSPVRPLGLTLNAAQNNLDTNPLLLNSEPLLERLFSQEAGPFGTYLNNFKRFAARLGYRDQPPTVGVSSNIFSVFGYQGTGKTTFVQALMSWLKMCTPPGGQWHMHYDWSLTKVKDVQEQLTRVQNAELEIRRLTAPNSYSCVIADNLVSGVLERVLQLYDELTRDRVIFLFLVSSDSDLYQQLGGQGRRRMEPFRMRALSANDAVAFIRHRITAFRVPAQKCPAWLADHDLYPFDEQDIRSAFASGVFYTSSDTIALRDFSTMVNRMLNNRFDTLVDTLADDFDIAQTTAADVRDGMILLTNEYNQLVAA